MSKFETRIQKKNHSTIMLAGLKIFSQFGFRGSTLDQIAAESDMSKPNILYYFQSKDAIYEALLAQLLTDWLKPVRDINPDGDPIEELLTYAKHKIMMSRLYPRESRLYANEIIYQNAHKTKKNLTRKHSYRVKKLKFSHGASIPHIEFIFNLKTQRPNA